MTDHPGDHDSVITDTDGDAAHPHSIGWFGVGDQGAPTARAIAAAGYQAIVSDRRMRGRFGRPSSGGCGAEPPRATGISR